MVAHGPWIRYHWDATLCTTQTFILMVWRENQSHLSLSCLDTNLLVAKHQAISFTSWAIFLKVRISKIGLPHRSAEPETPAQMCTRAVKRDLFLHDPLLQQPHRVHMNCQQSEAVAYLILKKNEEFGQWRYNTTFVNQKSQTWHVVLQQIHLKGSRLGLGFMKGTFDI